MERIEYVSRMEDYAAFRDLDDKHIQLKLKPSIGTRKVILYWLILHGSLLACLRLLGIEWWDILVLGLVLIYAQFFFFVWFVRFGQKQTIREIQRHFQEGHLIEGPRVLQFDNDWIEFTCPDFGIRVLWQTIWAMIVSADWIVLIYGVNQCLYLRRQSVTAGDFDRFTGLALTRFREVKQQQGIEPKILQVDPNLKSFRITKAGVLNLLFGVLWGAIFVTGWVIFIALYWWAFHGLEKTSFCQEHQILILIAAIFGMILIPSTALIGLVGVILGAMGVLPGARKKSKPQI